MSKENDRLTHDEGSADRMMRGTLEGYRVEPDPGVWKAISRRLLWRELLRLDFRNLSPRLWAAGAAGVIIVSATLFFLPGTDDKIADTPAGEAGTAGNIRLVAGAGPASPSLQPVVSVPERTLAGAAGRLAGEPSGITARVTTAAPKVGPVRSSKTGPVAVSAVPASASRSLAARSIDPSPVQPPTDEVAPDPLARNTLETFSVSRMASRDAILSLPVVSADTLFTLKTPSGDVYRFAGKRPASQSFFSASLGLTPEAAFYRGDDAYTKTNFWLNGTVTWHISRFSLATGFGLGYTFDEGRYEVAYTSLDSVGYYQAVTSYTVGTGNEIVFHTKTVGVYDSLHHLGDSRTKDRYSYLQVPLLAGFRLVDAGKVSLAIQAGPAVSFLVGSRRSDPVIRYSNATITRIDDDTPARREVTWQIWSSAVVEYRVTRQVGIYLEPSFKYYLDTPAVNEGSGYKSPVAVGLGAGLRFTFGLKKD